MIVLKKKQKKCFNIPSGFRIIVIFVVEGNSGHVVFTEPRPLTAPVAEAVALATSHRSTTTPLKMLLCPYN